MLEVVILAAGKGTRMKSSLPKVLHTVGGKPMLSRVIETAMELSPAAIHVVAGHGSSQVEALCEQYPTVNVVQQTEQLGTGHAVAQAASHLNDASTCLVLYGDVPLINPETLSTLVEPIDLGKLAILTVELNDPTGYGRIIRDTSGQIVAIVEQKDASEAQRLVNEGNTGVMAMHSQDLKRWLPLLTSDNAQNEYYLTDIVALAKNEQCPISSHCVQSEYEVLGVNNRTQQAQLERALQHLLAEELMLKGVTLLDPSRFDCRGSLNIGSDVVIDVNCVFEGQVTLGDNVTVGANCVLKDCVIGDNTTIKPFTMIDDSSMDEGCDIGPFARVRPGTRLKQGVKLGNFVETKKTTIAAGSKVNHLSYVGDAMIGERVNVGAGTITCNYDGVNKWVTTIGDGAFIGSNTSLVAPVDVGAGATIGAGSTITATVPNDSLGVARGKQRNIKDWKRPVKADKQS